MSALVTIERGAIYLPSGVADRYFKNIEAVIILIRDNAVHILPVHQMASGGCLLKRRNRAGDRVASAPDVFHANGLGDWRAEALAAQWSGECGALIIPLPKV